jgi:hypothetical protein
MQLKKSGQTHECSGAGKRLANNVMQWNSEGSQSACGVLARLIHIAQNDDEGQSTRLRGI